MDMIWREQPVKLFQISTAACLFTLCCATQMLDLCWFLLFTAQNYEDFSTWSHNIQHFSTSSFTLPSVIFPSFWSMKSVVSSYTVCSISVHYGFYYADVKSLTVRTDKLRFLLHSANIPSVLLSLPWAFLSTNYWLCPVMLICVSDIEQNMSTFSGQAMREKLTLGSWHSIIELNWDLASSHGKICTVCLIFFTSCL